MSTHCHFNTVKKKYFSYSIDKIVSLRRNFSKALVVLSWFLLLLLSLFSSMWYISLAFNLKFFKVSHFASLSYKYIKRWFFHGQSEANGLGTNEISSNIFDLCHVSKVAAHFQKKNKMFVYSFKYPNNGKILKNEAAEPYLEPCYLNLWWSISAKIQTTKASS